MTTAPTQHIEGYWTVVPVIRSISFPTPDRLQVELEDGRTVSMSLERFPSIERLTTHQRQCWYKYGNGFSFDDSDEVVHIEQILGNVNLYRHEP